VAYEHTRKERAELKMLELDLKIKTLKKNIRDEEVDLLIWENYVTFFKDKSP
jgi:hypothetical protein